MVTIFLKLIWITIVTDLLVQNCVICIITTAYFEVILLKHDVYKQQGYHISGCLLPFIEDQASLDDSKLDCMM